MAQNEDKLYRWNGSFYVPFHTAPLAAGPFLSASPNWVEQHVMLPSDFLLDRYMAGVGIDRAGLAAARVQGDSMIYRGVFDGDIVVFQRYEFDYVQNGKVVVIEKMGEEEGMGAWALKKLVVELPRLSHRNEYEEETDWDDPEIVLRSDNPSVSMKRLDPQGQYRVHGVLRRSLGRQGAAFVD